MSVNDRLSAPKEICDLVLGNWGPGILGNDRLCLAGSETRKLINNTLKNKNLLH